MSFVSFEGFRLGLWSDLGMRSDHRFGAGLATCIPEPAVETSLLESLSSPGVVMPVPLLLVGTPSAR